MINRIKTLLEYGTPEWRSDLKLALLTVCCCAAIILFFSADYLIGAIMLKAIYFRYGIVIALILFASMLLIIMKWANISLVRKLVITSIYAFMGMLLLGNSNLIFLASLLSELVISIGVFWIGLPTLLVWIVIAIYTWKKGQLSKNLTDPLFTRLIIIISLLVPACYAAIQHINSLDFTVAEHYIVEADNYYSVTFTSLSSDTISGTVIAHYKCNPLSLFCEAISE